LRLQTFTSQAFAALAFALNACKNPPVSRQKAFIPMTQMSGPLFGGTPLEKLDYYQLKLAAFQACSIEQA